METLIKKLNNLSLRKYFVVSVLATLVIIVLLSLITIWGCMSFRKYMLPDSNNVFLKVYRTYEDGSEVSYSVRVRLEKREQSCLLLRQMIRLQRNL